MVPVNFSKCRRLAKRIKGKLMDLCERECAAWGQGKKERVTGAKEVTYLGEGCNEIDA